MPQHAKVEHDNGGNEGPQQHQEFALGDEVGFASFVNQLRDFTHGAVHGQVLQPHEDDQAETEAEGAEQQPDGQQAMPVHAEERNRREVGQFQGRLAAFFCGWSSGLRQRVAGGQKQQSGNDCRSSRKAFLRNPASRGHKIGGISAHHNPPKDSYSGVTTCDFAPER